MPAESIHFMKRKALALGLARALSLSFATACMAALIAQSSGCAGSLPTAPLSDVVRYERGPAAAPTTSGAFDDDLTGGFFFGTKCATVRLRPRPFNGGTNARISPPAASIERAAGELP
jgi:hypothetical protein